MKFKKKDGIDFLKNGGCFLYCLNKSPKCLLTFSLLKSNIDIFNDEEEEIEFLENDCSGYISQCPYIGNIWNISYEDEIEESEEIDLVEEIEDNIEEEVEEIEEDISLDYNDVHIDFEYSCPPESDSFTDGLIIPTDSYLNFEKFVTFDDDNNEIIRSECRKRQLRFDLGDCLVTHGGNTGYPLISHGIIESGDEIIEVMSIGMAIYNSLIDLDGKGCKSVAISPLLKIDKDMTIPNLDLYLKISITSVITFIEENNAENISYILIHIPSNFVNHLQDVIKDIQNIP